MTTEADKNQKTRDGKGSCSCPFCDAPVENMGPLCKACGVTANRCSRCGKLLAKGQETCPNCDG